MNFANMMQQAQKMQKKLQDAQADLSAMDIAGEAGNGAVKVVCNGNKTVLDPAEFSSRMDFAHGLSFSEFG